MSPSYLSILAQLRQYYMDKMSLVNRPLVKMIKVQFMRSAWTCRVEEKTSRHRNCRTSIVSLYYPSLMTHFCSKTVAVISCKFNLREISNIPDIFCIKPLLTNCLVCHNFALLYSFLNINITMSAEGHPKSKELICQISCFQWVKSSALIIVV